MNPERLLQNFNRLIDTPDAVPSLRRFILDLAVWGKLVEQNPEDEPAEELVKRIRAKEKGHLGRSRSAEHGPFTIADVPFEIPQTWEWVHATEPAVLISDNGKKVQTKDALESGRFPVVDQGKIFIRGYCNDADKVISAVEPIIVFGDHTRETKLIDFDFVVGADGVKLLKPIHIDPAYYYLALQWVPLDNRGYGRHFKLLRASFIPLPPLAEQHRIVAKVDELMKLCDELEAAQAKRERRRDRLVAATLHGLNNGSPDSEAREVLPFKDSTRFYFNHLSSLTTRPEHIQHLRQTILNLAVRGKLVPQDPTDEPVVELLKRILTEKAQLVKEGKIGKEKPNVPIQSDSAPFEIPASWKWVRLDMLTELITKGSSPKWQGVQYVSNDMGILFVTSENVGNYCLRKMDEPKYVEKRFNEIESRSILRFEDILMNLVGASIGRTALYDLHDEANINQAVAVIRLVSCTPNLSKAFLLHYFNSPFAIQFMLSSQVITAQPNISLTNAREFPIPLPPLAEQHRIVAKVDELMALCDEMESRITTCTTTSRQLLEATLQEALNGQFELHQGVTTPYLQIK